MDSSRSGQKYIGTLASLSSLGDGTFAVAPAFLDWLHKTHQNLWQFLPLHTTELEPGSNSHVPSPYKGYGIGIDPKYLSILDKKRIPTVAQKKSFCEKHQDWLPDYTLFCSLRDYFHTDDWRTWDKSLRTRDLLALERWSLALEKEVDHQVILQWQLHEAMHLIKEEAKIAGITLSGDLPFYLSLCSPLVWANQEAFEIESDGSLQFVSGVTDFPPSFFGRQVWGHPLYHWQAKEKWEAIIFVWKLRLRYIATLYKSVRFDYAEAFYHYGAMNILSPHHDHKRIGPGAVVFEELLRYAREMGLSVFVEDSGTQTAEMEASLSHEHCPGITIFCFNPDISKYHEQSVVFTTTHDTETLLSYIARQTPEQKKFLARDCEVTYDPDDRVFARTIRNRVIESAARTVIIPIQDWLLTTDRMNIPGSEQAVDDPNWRYRVGIPIQAFPLV